MEILTHPNKLLRKKADKINQFDNDLKIFADDLIKMMIEYDGVGLAAVQIGASKQIIAINIEEKENIEGLPMPMVLINPIVLRASAEMVEMDEACLSVPGKIGSVVRPVDVTVNFQNIEGVIKHIDATGWMSRVLQHEIDHLNGILFIDRITDKEKLRNYEPKNLKTR